MLPQPDPTRDAPRPSAKEDRSDPRPDLDHPPPAHSHDQPSFDRATAAADDEARTGEPTHQTHSPPTDEPAVHPAPKKGKP
jgi:hypothetical protein